MFAAAANRVKYYLAERDPVGIGGPTNFNPFTNTADSAANLKSDPIGVAKAAPQQFTSVAGRHRRGQQRQAGGRHQRRRRPAGVHHRPAVIAAHATTSAARATSRSSARTAPA